MEQVADRFYGLGAWVVARRLSVVVPVAYMAVLLVIATVPTEDTLDQRHYLWFFALVPSTIQNLLHIPAYGLLAFFWRWTLDRYTTAKAATILAFLLTTAFGIFQEWCQSMVPGRFASLTDVIFNTFGAIIGLWVFARCASMISAELKVLS